MGLQVFFFEAHWFFIGAALGYRKMYTAQIKNPVCSVWGAHHREVALASYRVVALKGLSDCSADVFEAIGCELNIRTR